MPCLSTFDASSNKFYGLISGTFLLCRKTFFNHSFPMIKYYTKGKQHRAGKPW
ncbi:hypothetical protein CLOHYLEM_06096 [[Clostridium] hylemonae DSM 15053]|uniref:Uncharacterized protein n=1 Tax=[Clostridium] hylemonae DSM 15053 TaxID=553973 RepID=C0C1S6_9FIRM|nr:hypothetical protein CLOHYLEM_06096 [[Clostridium] hylemonae DSM 15053]